MNNERYNQIIDEAYENYKHYFENKYGNYITGRITKEDGDYLIVNKHPLPQETILSIIYSKEEFINKCKNDSEFSERWGLKIEEREWSVKERLFFVNKSNEEYEKALANKTQYESIGLDFELALTSRMNELNIPTKLITVTYKDEKIEVYE